MIDFEIAISNLSSPVHARSRTTHSSPVRRDRNATIRGPMVPIKMERGSSWQASSSSMKREYSEGSDVPTPPNTAPLPCSATFDMAPIPPSSFFDVSALNMDFTACGTAYDSSNYSPMTNDRASPACSSFRSTPELAPMKLFTDDTDSAFHYMTVDLEEARRLEGTRTPRKKSTTRSQPSSPRKQAQMPDNTVITETGITSEVVDSFVQGPDESGKYMCLYEGCNMKPFGRKENIRAHVQTHLGDRKFTCGTCTKQFVRPNDLKRHALIHQEDKDFVCTCGSKFGRADALRRHRSRNPECAKGDPTLLLQMKEAKPRGRPKMKAPIESAERRERKENTRRKFMEQKRANSETPSTTSSYPSPGAFDNTSQQTVLSTVSEFIHADTMSFTPPASPEENSDVAAFYAAWEIQPSPFVKGISPSPPPTRGSMMASGKTSDTVMLNSSIADTDAFGPCDEALPPNSPFKRSSSQYGTPPELDLSSSPASRLLDFGHTDSDPSTQATSIDDFMMSPPSNDFDNMFPPLFGENQLPNIDGFDKVTQFAGLNGTQNDPFWDLS